MKLIADSSCDVHTLAGVSFCAVPLTISTEEQSFLDDSSLDVKRMLDHLREYKGRSYTACPGVDAWLQAFGEEEEIYVVTITSSLSGAYNSAMAARELYLQEHPGANIAVFDSLSTGPEILLLLEKIAELTRQGMAFQQVVETVEAYMHRTRLFFTLHSLHNLAQNGRVNKVVAAAVGVMNIRILGTASPEGTLATITKARGDKRATAALLEQLEQAGYRGGKLRLTHVHNGDLAVSVAGAIREKYPQADIHVSASGGLCSYYAEEGSLLVGVETEED